jgi:glutaconate CoA-transferase, subunit B
MPTSCSDLERIAILLSRELQDNDIGSWGVGGIIPMAAIMLAKKMHAPGIIIGGERVYNPKPSSLAAGLDDPVLMEKAEAIEGFWELFGHWHKGVDFFFYSGMQIDVYGNLNLHLIGSIENPKLRGPGVANISLIQRCKKIYLYSPDHSTKKFVEKVDFISAPGHLFGPQSKKDAGIFNEGPVICVTPIATFDFDPVTLRMRIKSIHSHSTFEEVKSKTGFELNENAPTLVTIDPTDLELKILREQIDLKGLLRK